MAFAISAVKTFKDCGQEFHAVLTIQGSSTYTTGGDACSTAHAKIKTTADPTFGMGVATGGYVAHYDTAAKKWQLWNGTTEFGSGADVSTTVLDVSVYFPKA